MHHARLQVQNVLPSREMFALTSTKPKDTAESDIGLPCLVGVGAICLRSVVLSS